VAEESSAPPPPVSAAVEEGYTVAEATTPQAILELPAKAGPSDGDVVMILDEDPTPPPSSRSRDVVMTPVSEPTPVAAVVDPSPVVEVPEPSPVVETLEPSLAAGAAGTSSAVGVVTVEEVMELATSRYIDFPSVGNIDLEAPQLPEKVLDVATEQMFAEPSIMETIASASKELHEYERADDFAPTAVAEAVDAALEAPVVSMELAASASAPPPTSENWEASLAQSAEAAKTTTTVAAIDTTEVVVREAGSSPPYPVAAGADEVRALDGPATTVQERVAPETTTRAASPKIQDAEETGASLSQGAASGEAQALELACTPWAATFGSGDDIKDG
jgi:hypothetical protein